MKSSALSPQCQQRFQHRNNLKILEDKFSFLFDGYRVFFNESIYLLHVLGKVMNLCAVLVGHDRVFSGTSVGTQNHTILENDAHNGGASFGCLGQRVSLIFQGCIPVGKFKQVFINLQ